MGSPVDHPPSIRHLSPPVLGEGGFDMAQSSNIIPASNDFLLAISVRFEGRNARGLALRFFGVIAALVALAARIYSLRLQAP